MLPRHSRTHPLVMRIRSFAWTRSISSFQRLTETSVPSSSTAFASATFPVEPLRLEKSRASPFCRIVSSMTSTLLSGRRSLTFIRPAPRTSRFRLNISAGDRDGKSWRGSDTLIERKGRSFRCLPLSRGNSFGHRNKTYNDSSIVNFNSPPALPSAGEHVDGRDGDRDREQEGGTEEGRRYRTRRARDAGVPGRVRPGER